jgi:hypothetical protein
MKIKSLLLLLCTFLIFTLTSCFISVDENEDGSVSIEIDKEKSKWGESKWGESKWSK